MASERFQAEIYPPETCAELLSIRQGLAEQLRQMMAVPGANCTTVFNSIWEQYVAVAQEKELPPIGLNFTLGNVVLPRRGESQEDEEYLSLAAEMGLDTKSLEFWGILYEQVVIRRTYEETHRPLGGYKNFRGLLEARQAFSLYLTHFGLTIPAEGTYFSSGGASTAAERAIRAAFAYQNKNSQPSGFLSTGPTYTPISSMVDGFAGIKHVRRACSERNNYFFTPEELGTVIKQEQIGIIYVVPIGNPNPTMIPPDQLRETMRVARIANPNIIPIIDLAYISTIPQEKVMQMFIALKEAGVLEQCIFITSLSKTHGRPGSRLGAYHTLNYRVLEPYIKIACEAGNPVESDTAGLEATAILRHVSWQAVEKLSRLYTLRRSALIQTLADINNKLGKDIFVNPDQLVVDGSMYVYARLADGIDAAELFRLTGILGIDGQYFDDEPDNRSIRFSIGAVETPQIKQLPLTLALLPEN